MKKVFFVFVILCLLTTVLCGCVFEKADKFDELNKMVAVANKNFKVTVTTDANNADALTSEFNVSVDGEKLIVEYSVEQFADFSDGVPESYKKTLCGKVVAESGVTVEQSGDSVDFALEKIADLDWNFQNSYFSNARWTNASFSAQVENVSAFWDRDISATNMTVSASFSTTLQKVEIAYTAGGTSVQIVYDFC